MTPRQEQQLRDRDEQLSRMDRISPVSLSEELATAGIYVSMERLGMTFEEYINHINRDKHEAHPPNQ